MFGRSGCSLLKAESFCRLLRLDLSFLLRKPRFSGLVLQRVYIILLYNFYLLRSTAGFQGADSHEALLGGLLAGPWALSCLLKEAAFSTTAS